MKFFAFAAVASALVVPDASMLSQLTLADAVQDVPPIFDPVVVGKGWSSNLTIYQLIASCKYTTNFTALVDRFPAVVDLLNTTTTTTTTTTTNHTLFVPVNTAFAALPDGGGVGSLPPDVAENIVRYHIGLGDYGYNVLFATHTVPTAYREPLLNDGAAQRLRVRYEKGLRINQRARVLSHAANVAAANGIVHAIDAVLAPPSFVGRELSRVPARYSTLLLAMATTNFTNNFIHRQPLNGSTVLAPSNAAFARLGADVNAFLFGSTGPRGLKYLEALLKYMIVPNATVYSDAYYGGGGAAVQGPVVRTHYDLPTFLGSARVTINITSVPGYTIMRVNDEGVKVAVQDLVAKNGVIQEVGDIVLPPLPGAAGAPNAGWGGHKKGPITLAELIARLGPYVDDDETEPPAAEAVEGTIEEL